MRDRCRLTLADFDDDPYFRKGEYRVLHFHAGSFGRAYGPLGLDQTMRFCTLLHAKLTGSPRTVWLFSPSSEPEYRSNAAVLLGAYLIVHRKWSAKRLESVLPHEAMAAFPCSWSGRPSSGPQQPDVLQVQDCWAGLELARDKLWIPAEVVEDDVKCVLACSMWRRRGMAYDAAWLIPFRLAVSADPVTSVQDPDPCTCSSLLPTELPSPADPEEDLVEPTERNSLTEVEEAETTSSALPGALPKSLAGESPSGPSTSGRPGSALPSSCVSERESEGMVLVEKPPEPVSHVVSWHIERKVKDDELSCHTVCKDSQADSTGELYREQASPPKDFYSWCVESGIRLIVRANSGDEPGLREHGGTYDPSIFTSRGLGHLHLHVVDKNGGVPDADSVCRLVDQCEGLLRAEAVLIHCKGGFGRSVVLACLLTIVEMDVPGRALLGWARIARPGAITTPQQEHFLCGMHGKADVERYCTPSTRLCCAQQ